MAAPSVELTLPLRLGMTPWHISSTMTADTLCQQAELAEDWGYQSFWLPESHFAGKPSLPDPMLLLAAIAARTTTIKLATTSYLLPIRHPLHAAEQVAVLDQLSNGRLILGLGRGFQAGMLDAFQLSSKEKRARFEQVLATMQDAWAGQTVGSAEHGAVLAPLPKQRPHPPLWMAAFGPKALAQAAKLGVPYLASPMETLQKLEDNFSTYYAALAQFENPRPPEVAVMRTVFISDDPSRCERIRNSLMELASRSGSNAEPVDQSCLIGNTTEVAQQIMRYQRQLGMNYLVATRPRIPKIESEWCRESMRQLAVLVNRAPAAN
ncbi:MAG: LLM class flavin-dependent oxidoreductase [Halieaceae bacterium]|jgi:alkanesulfonate monooxygenase SsuD/methylene tetrahydromethanopterin reductase-like flavin-dependent oxidoreductase (luciferase family)|nr:LLM class flavin-dependent oxidoreductase [Halieaceae bacterium]